jgi:hypothetical protein
MFIMTNVFRQIFICKKMGVLAPFEGVYFSHALC